MREWEISAVENIHGALPSIRSAPILALVGVGVTRIGKEGRLPGRSPPRANPISWVTTIMVRPSLGQVAHHLQHLAHQLRVEGRGRLVEEEHVGAPWPAPGRWRHAAVGHPICEPGSSPCVRTCRPCGGWPSARFRTGLGLGQLSARAAGPRPRSPCTVMWVHRLKLWNTMPRRVRMRSTCLRSAGSILPSRPGRISMVSPLTVTVPEFGVSRRLMQRRNVLLPEPDEPSMEITSPSPAVIEMPFSTSMSPKLLWMSSTTRAASAIEPPSGRLPRREIRPMFLMFKGSEKAIPAPVATILFR